MSPLDYLHSNCRSHPTDELIYPFHSPSFSGEKQIFVQEPTGYYFPGLPQIQFFDPANFAWVAEIESGSVRLIPAEEVHAQARRLIRR